MFLQLLVYFYITSGHGHTCITLVIPLPLSISLTIFILIQTSTEGMAMVETSPMFPDLVPLSESTIPHANSLSNTHSMFIGSIYLTPSLSILLSVTLNTSLT